MKSDEQDSQENNVSDHMRKWEILVDEQVRKVIGDGNMSWHPGAGRPLKLDEDAFISEADRLAHKLMKDADAVPPWIALAVTLRDKRRKIEKRARQYAKDFVWRTQEALRLGSFIRDQHARDRWRDATRQLQEDIVRYNSELLDYNLQIPPQIQQMVPLNGEALIAEALQQAQREQE